MLNALSRLNRIILYILVIVISPKLLVCQAAQDPLDGSSFVIRPNEGFDGSPFIFEEFKEGSLIDNKGEVYEGLRLNYDAMNDAMIVLKVDGGMISINKYYYRQAVIDNVSYQNMSAYNTTGFARVLYDGKNLKAFEKTKASKQTTNRNSYNQVSAKYKIVQTEETLVWINDELVELRRRNKDFYELFGKSDVKAFLQKEDLNIKIDNDFTRFLAHFDSVYPSSK